MVQQLMTDRVYYREMETLKWETEIQERGIEGGEPFLVPAATIFHPMGGGQASDTGNIVLQTGRRLEVTRLEEVGKKGEVIRHYVRGVDGEPVALEELEGKIALEIDERLRKNSSILHTGGHAIQAILQKQFPQMVAFMGDHREGSSNVRFVGKPVEGGAGRQDMPNPQAVFAFLEGAWSEMVAAPTPTVLHNDDPFKREVTILGFQQSCGGTHVDATDKLGRISIDKCKLDRIKPPGLLPESKSSPDTKVPTLKVSYSLKPGLPA